MAAETVELDKDAFMRLVTEEHLQVEGPSGGYLYTGKRGRNGWELYKTPNNPWYLYQARRINTQGAANGALTTRISMPAGVVGIIQAMYVRGALSAATLEVYRYDEDGAQMGLWASVAAGATRQINLPSIGSAASATNNPPNTTDTKLGPGEILAATTSAALQTETLTVGVVILLSAPTEPTWDTTGSAGTPSLAASTISAANTMQMVAMP